jgi:hypothetical protein
MSATETPEQSRRRATFKAATVGMRAYTISLAMNRMLPGHEWRGCSKSELCDVYMGCGKTGAELRRFLTPGKRSQKP